METQLLNGTDPTPRDSRLIKGKKGRYNQIGQDTTQMDNANPYDMDNDQFVFEQMGDQMHSLRLKEQSPFNGVIDPQRRMSQDSDAVYGISKEIYNFSSAP